jgi:hypothetical protein
MKPAVMHPSHMPRIKRATKRPAKLVQAAWQANAMPQIKILMLVDKLLEFGWLRRNFKENKPNPSTHRETLEREILRIFE